MLAVRLDNALEARLTSLAKKTGRTKSFFARQAIETLIEDLEDTYLAEERMTTFDPETTIPLGDIMADLDLDR
ncbi:MAG: CopG family transcriptional regulator [Pacificimonas sp.]